MDGMTLKDAATEQGVMPKGKDASVGILRQVLAQPLLLRRPLATTAQILCAAIRIQSKDVPRPEIKAVVTSAYRTRLCSPILKIGRGCRLGVFVVPQCRLRATLEFSPGRPITILEFRRAALLISKVSCGKDRSWYLFDELGGSASSL